MVETFGAFNQPFTPSANARSVRAGSCCPRPVRLLALRPGRRLLSAPDREVPDREVGVSVTVNVFLSSFP